MLTPSFNSGKYLERAIKSVIEQDYPHVEHIIMDGGSTDETISILKKYPHLIWKSEKDKGQADAMNKAFALSTGEVIVYLNADDYFEPGTFKVVTAEFEKDETIDMVIGNGININIQHNTQKEWKSEISYTKCLQFYKYQFPMNPVSYFYKRHVQEKVGYNEHEHYTMDYSFILRAFQLFHPKKVERIFGYFVEDGTNKTSDGQAYSRLKESAIAHCKKYDKSKLLIYVPYFIRKKLLSKLTTKEMA